MGSAPNTAATATVSHPAIQGLIQSLGVFIDTMVVCSITALIILVSGLYDPANPAAVAGASLTQAAVAQSFGVGGQWVMTIVVFAFCFSSVLGNYAYADANLTFLGAGPKSFFWFRIVAIAAVLLGSVTALPLVWAIADVAMGLMTLVAAIVMLSRWVVLVLADYERSLEASREPVFSGKAAGMPALPSDSNW
jgi:AGCS family alanine or glycine:cation symporter